ncbi:hypothetical protein L2Y90_34310 (plasmid) [Burkholderia pyrrocinia]|uniref:hypothetical protein n=1 Tax=Burkholderia pyrrocinia TaxID=60550 RepID=UPI00215AA72F|nr:hypothetical protein [Burkholderia pyrrocinia]UVE70187.1 hypothetical protein L2Y90_34310 [Burkholderia pyrrocinia]
MTHPLCQRRHGADRTIRLFFGDRGPSRGIDANRLERRGATRIPCRSGRSIRQHLLRERPYD